MQDRDLLEKYNSKNNKIFHIYEEHKDGKFVFYAESSGSERCAEIEADPKEITDPTKDATSEILRKIKEKIDSL